MHEYHKQMSTFSWTFLNFWKSKRLPVIAVLEMICNRSQKGTNQNIQKNEHDGVSAVNLAVKMSYKDGFLKSVHVPGDRCKLRNHEINQVLGSKCW